MSGRVKTHEVQKSQKENSQLEFRCILTGFNGFGPNIENPSQMVSQAMPKTLKVGKRTEVKLTSLVLPTCCSQAWSELKPHLKGKANVRNIVILMGLAAKRDRINLERLAINVRDYAIKDNSGHTYDGTPIEDGPLALSTDLPLISFRKRLIAAGFPAVISNHAGTFVCNDLYYRSLFYQLKNGSPDLVLFVHVPRLARFRQTVNKEGNKKTQDIALSARTRSRQIELMQLAINEVIKSAILYLQENENTNQAECEKSVPAKRSKKIQAQSQP